MKRYYFDHCASTPMNAIVVETVTEVMKQHYANSAALHRAGADAMKLVDRARANIAGLVGAQPHEVVFTSGGTESNNFAIKGSLFKVGRSSKHMITTEIEHASVYECARQMEMQGVAVTYLPVHPNGKVKLEELRKAIQKDTVLVSIMHVNNETGVIQPIQEIGEILSAYPQIRYHVDGVQAIGKIPFSWKDSQVQLYSGSAHKFGGPKGVGFLLVKEGTELAPLLCGGEQETTRSGTHNVPGIVGMAQALRLTLETQAERGRRLYQLKKQLLNILSEMPELLVNGNEADLAPHILSLSYPGMRPEVMVHVLEELGILVSTQSACSSRSLKPSRVLLAMGYDEARSSGCIRISLGEEHTSEDIALLGDRLKQAVAKLKPLERNS